VTSSDAKLNFCVTGEYFSLGTKGPNDLLSCGTIIVGSGPQAVDEDARLSWEASLQSTCNQLLTVR
jgi:hypothetical protein